VTGAFKTTFNKKKHSTKAGKMRCTFRVVFGLLALVAVALQFDVFGIATQLSAVMPALQIGMAGLVASIVAPFPVDPELTAIAVAYKNPAFIADQVFPRVQVGKSTFKYRVFSKADSFTIPDTLVARASAPNQVNFGYTEESSFCLDNALDEPIPQDDIDNAPAGYDPRARAAASVTDLIELKREERAATLLFTAGNYASTCKATLTGTDQFSHADAAPFDLIEDALESMVMRGNVIVFGQTSWTAFKRHANVVARVLGSANAKGVVTPQMVADALEVKSVLVGRGRYNSAAKGQTVSLSRLWGDFCSLIYQDAMADTRGRISFGYTAQFGSRVSGSIVDQDLGSKGGVRVRAAEYVRELITANDLGYLLSDTVA
jgi:hypothetical protein